MARYLHFLCIGQVVCQTDILHAGLVAMYMPTILYISCIGKIDYIHEQWLLANIPTSAYVAM